jgi:hypothetical protein
MPDPKLANWRSKVDIDAERAAEQAERDRLDTIRADALRQDMVDKLSVATPQQISDFVDANVTNLAGARNMFKRILLLLAPIVKD